MNIFQEQKLRIIRKGGPNSNIYETEFERYLTNQIFFTLVFFVFLSVYSLIFSLYLPFILIRTWVLV